MVDEKKKKGVVVEAIDTYVNKVSRDIGQGIPRRVEAVRMMFEELGADKYVTRVSLKGTEMLVFKK